MNVSLTAIPQNDPVWHNSESVEDSIEEHRKIMENVGFNLTGNTLLLNEPKADEVNYPGSYRVWLETTAMTWVYVDTEGNAHETGCPIEDPTEVPR